MCPKEVDHSLSEADDLILRELKRILDSLQYDTIIRTISPHYFTDPWRSKPFLRARLSRVSEDYATIINTFCLKIPISKSDLHDVLGTQLIEGLSKLGILKESGNNHVVSRYSIIPYFKKYFFVDYDDTHDDQFNIYFGDDSVDLVNYCQDLTGEKALDLCTGSGVQAVLLSDRFKNIRAVDINPEVEKLFDYNLRVNNISNIAFSSGDLYEGLDETYDVIVANPPFVALPSSLKTLPLAGYGGETGTEITMDIIKQLPRFLNRPGHFKSYFTLGRSGGKMLLVPYLKEFLKEHEDCEISLILAARVYYRKFVKGYSRILSRLYNHDFDSIYAQIEAHYLRREIDFIYSAFIYIKRIANSSNSLTVVNLASGLDIEKRMMFTYDYELAPHSKGRILLRFSNGVEFVVSENFQVFLDNYDGHETIKSNITKDEVRDGSAETVSLLEHLYSNGLIVSK